VARQSAPRGVPTRRRRSCAGGSLPTGSLIQRTAASDDSTPPRAETVDRAPRLPQTRSRRASHRRRRASTRGRPGRRMDHPPTKAPPSPAPASGRTWRPRAGGREPLRAHDRHDRRQRKAAGARCTTPHAGIPPPDAEDRVDRPRDRQPRAARPCSPATVSASSRRPVRRAVNDARHDAPTCLGPRPSRRPLFEQLFGVERLRTRAS